MAIQVRSTREVSLDHGVKILVMGRAKVGKTVLCSTLPRPLIISAEAGLLSLAGHDLPSITVTSIFELSEAYAYVQTAEARQLYDSICLDSISEIGEQVLATEKRRLKDARQAYGELADRMDELIKNFRDLSGYHVYMSAKIEPSEDYLGRTIMTAMIPGKKIAPKLPYMFDLVCSYRAEQAVQDGQLMFTEDGQPIIRRWLQTAPDGQYEGGDRSGALNYWEEPHLGNIIAKIGKHIEANRPQPAAEAAPQTEATNA